MGHLGMAIGVMAWSGMCSNGIDNGRLSKVSKEGWVFSSSKNNNNKLTATVVATKKRTTMKPEAAQGIGPYFGMESRYDGADIGLNPVLYWSNENFRAIKKVNVERLTRA
jgi:hypothetical protein